MANEVISIITPSYNQALYLEQTIDSILSQNHPNLEYIIIDGGSRDGSVDIIKKYEKYLKFWVSESDRGQSHAINKGISKASGDIINWINSDDYYESGAFKHVAEAFEDPDIEVAAFKGKVIDERGKLIRYSKGTDIYKDLAKTIGWARIDQPETFFRKSVFDKITPLNENLHYTMDLEMWIRHLLEFGTNKVILSDEFLVNFRFHQDSKSSNYQNLFRLERNWIFNRLAEQANVPFPIISCPHAFELNYKIKEKPLVRKALSYHFLRCADEAYYEGKYQEFKTLISYVDIKVLDEEGVKIYRKLNQRNNHLVFTLRNWLKKSTYR
jgi:glycosyltransferase involved in cell wall biosynthesis